MGLNSTATAYNFGQFGSTLLKGDGAKLLLNSDFAKYYICAVTMVTAVKFELLESLDGGIGMAMPNTAFVGTEALKVDATWNKSGDDTTNEANEDSDPVTNADEFPAGLTIYGMWDNVELHEGTAIAYVAPRPDYRTRAKQ